MSTVRYWWRPSTRRSERTPRLNCLKQLLGEPLEDRCLLSGATSAPSDDPHNAVVMSRNLYIGAELGPLLAAAQTGDQMVVAGAIGAFWKDVQLRDFPARAAAVATEIAEQQPALVGLQEVAQFIAGDVRYPNGTTVPGSGKAIDYLELLLQELNTRGLHYSTVVSTPGFGGLFTGLVDTTRFGFQDVQYTDRDVILARTDMPAPALLLSNAQGGNFAASVPVNFLGTVLPIKRSWTSVDVQMWGQDFRFVNAHLEDDNPAFPAFGAIQVMQAQELIAPGGPTDVNMPVVLVGDFNSSADRSGTDSYKMLTVAAGFTDSWTVTHTGDPGYTWSENGDLRGNPVTTTPPPTSPLERIDLLLYRGEHLRAKDMQRVMRPVTPSNPVTGPLWPSDHAGVVATLGLRVGDTGQDQSWIVVNDDPLLQGEQAVYLVGTDGSDQISVDQYANGQVAVTMANQRHLLQPTTGGRIYAHAGGGHDTVRLSSRVNRAAMVFAGDGDDRVYGGSGNDEIHGGDGRDLLCGKLGEDKLFGEAGADLIFGGAGNDWLSGGDGNDHLFGRAGNDQLYGGAGQDQLYGGVGDDRLFGEAGNDWLHGEAGDDLLDGGEGSNWLSGGAGRNVLRKGRRL